MLVYQRVSFFNSFNRFPTLFLPLIPINSSCLSSSGSDAWEQVTTVQNNVGLSKTSVLAISMKVSYNVGTPISSLLIRFSIRNHPFWGSFTPCLMKPEAIGSAPQGAYAAPKGLPSVDPCEDPTVPQMAFMGDKVVPRR